METRVRIADIAEELGLSTATVSNVIHGKTGKVSPETVRRVQEALERREYIPSMAGILLAQNDSKIIGVVINDHEKYEGHALEDGFISACINALTAQADRAGLFLMLKLTTQWSDISRFASMWNMVGLVLIGFCDQDYVNLRGRTHIPFVVYDGYFEQSANISNLIVDNVGGGRLIGQYLRDMGHRKVLCAADNTVCTDWDRFQGLRQILPDAHLLQVPMRREERLSFYRARLDELLSHTAVFAVSDYYAVELIQFLQQSGYSVPDDLSVAGFDNSSLGRMIRPALTTVAQDTELRASLALDLLTRLRQNSADGQRVTIPVSLVERDSVRRL